MKMNFRFAIALVFLAGSLAGCGSKSDDVKSQSIGPQFWLYDVGDYDPTSEDVVEGLGGRWISVRYEAKAATNPDRAAKVEEIIEAFTADGWRQEALPSGDYVLSEIYETSGDDLYFTRSARGTEATEWRLANVIHVSDDGRILCSYCEVGW